MRHSSKPSTGRRRNSSKGEEIVNNGTEDGSSVSSMELKKLHRRGLSLRASNTAVDIINSATQYKLRTKYIREILQTEETFVNSLFIAIKNFFHPLREDATKHKDSILPMEVIIVIFSNMEDIHSVHENFLKILKKRVQNWSPLQKVGGIILKLVPKLSAYTQYICKFDYASKALAENLQNNIKFRSFVEAIMKLPGIEQNLQSYLIMPVQRIPRYKLLVEGLLKKTPEDHPDYADLQTALQELDKKAQSINRAKLKAESRGKLDEIQHLLLNSKLPKCQEINIISNQRYFRREGLLDVSFNRDKITQYYCYLFNDAILITKHKKDKGMTFFKLVPLEGAAIMEGSQAEKPLVQIFLAQQTEELMIVFASNKEKALWQFELKTLEKGPPQQNKKTPQKSKKGKPRKSMTDAM